MYGDAEAEEAYFDHLFRRALDMDLHGEEGTHSYDDLVDHLSAINSEIDGSALEEAREAYRLNFIGEDLYEIE